jgi:hypothetical protein
MYAVDSLPKPSPVLAHTQLVLGHAQHELHPVLKKAPVQMPVPPKGVPPHIPVASVEVM